MPTAFGFNAALGGGAPPPPRSPLGEPTHGDKNTASEETRGKPPRPAYSGLYGPDVLSVVAASSGGGSGLSGAAGALAAYSLVVQRAILLAGRGPESALGGRARRYADLGLDSSVAHALLRRGIQALHAPRGATPSPATLPPVILRFDVDPNSSAASDVALSNARRTAAVISRDDYFWHSSGASGTFLGDNYINPRLTGRAAPTPRKVSALALAPPVRAFGRAPGPPPTPPTDLLLPVLPTVSLPLPVSAAGSSFIVAGTPSGGGSGGGFVRASRRAAIDVLPVGRASVTFVIDDAARLGDYDPESLSVRTAAAAWEAEAAIVAAALNAGVPAPSLQLPALDLALCVMAAAVDIDGVNSSSEAVMLWMITNSGHILARAPAPHAGVGEIGPLLHLTSGLPWGVGSALTVSIDSATGDVGVTVSNSRCGWEEEEGSESISSTAAAASPFFPNDRLKKSTAVGTRAGPHPFSLINPHEAIEARLAATAMHDIPQQITVIHAPMPHHSPAARAHAAVCRLPLNAIAVHARALQFALLVRDGHGVIATLVP